MYLNRHLLIALSLFVFSSLKAQEYIHFSQFTYLPLSVNPAQAGLFEGSYRVGGLFKSHRQTGSFKGSQTPVIYADVPIGGFRKQDWIGIGLNLHRDGAGSALLNNTLVAINGAYHMGMDMKQNTVLSFGVQAGYNQRNIDKSKLTFQDGILKGNSADLALIDDQNKSYTLVNVGINLRSKASKTTTFNVGLSVDNIIGAKYNLLTSTVAKLPRRFNLYSTLDVALNKRISLNPAVIFRTTAGTSEIMVHAVGGVKLDPKNNISVKGGLGYRLGDAAQLLLGMDYGDIRIGASYDYTLSSGLRDANAKNGFEIAIGYIGKIFRTKQPPPVILCPRY